MSVLVEGAKVMAKGQITLPKDIRQRLNVGTGDQVVLVADGDRVVMMNSAIFALQALQNSMHGAAEEAGFTSEADVADFITQDRRAGRNA